MSLSTECAAALLSFRYASKQDLKRIYRREFEFSNTSFFYQNALHLTRVHCATFYQSVLRHEEFEDVTVTTDVRHRRAFVLTRDLFLAYGWSAGNLNRPIRIQQAGKILVSLM